MHKMMPMLRMSSEFEIDLFFVAAVSSKPNLVGYLFENEASVIKDINRKGKLSFSTGFRTTNA